MVLPLPPDDVYWESNLGFSSKKALGGELIALVSPILVSTEIFCVAGFRHGRRGHFVPAKGPKTSDAPSGLIGVDGRRTAEGAPTRSAHTRPAS